MARVDGGGAAPITPQNHVQAGGGVANQPGVGAPALARNQNPVARQDEGGRSMFNAFTERAANFRSAVYNSLPNNPLRDMSVREQTYRVPLSRMEGNATTLFNDMDRANHHEQLREQALASFRGTHHATGDATQVVGQFQDFLAFDVDNLSANEVQQAEDNARQRTDNWSDGVPVSAHDFNVRLQQEKEIIALEKLAQLDHLPPPDESQEHHRMWGELSIGASLQRNVTMQETRDQLSFFGRQISVFMKKEGLGFDGLIDRKTAQLVRDEGLDPETGFNDLNNDQQIDVYKAVLKSASTANPNLMDKFQKTISTNLQAGAANFMSFLNRINIFSS
ncbi:hypothetical protein O5O45_09960 [Hahella aquimaris]|uniref:hypothetical protein n=1 Tax=Hahella sp. HNIBRBA332 TaxID=3015983 RepID=UPI00273AA365|nr:hypothetical protein [Hahella sp. HNIBRBA332]WLQ16239.1 hypothetical protein O5O45_09960 [Hahella sp. HNIBRBA332]